jgi:hypothetical protein
MGKSVQILARMGEKQWKFNATLGKPEMITNVGFRGCFLRCALLILRSVQSTRISGVDSYDKSHLFSN